MRLLVPLGDELLNLGRKVGLVLEVEDAEPLPLQNAEPLLDLVHPGAMYGREVQEEPRMLLEPRAHLFSVMRGDVIEDKVNGRDRLQHLRIEVFEKGDELLLPLAVEGPAVDLATAGIESSQELESAASFVFVLDSVGDVPRQGRFGGVGTRPWLERGLFVGAQHNFVATDRTRVQIDDLSDAGIELPVAWRLGAEPHVRPPRLEFVRGEDALNGRCRDGLDDAFLHELTSYVPAKPSGKGAASVVRPLASNLDCVNRDLGGKSWAGVPTGVCPEVRPCLPQGSAQPTCRPSGERFQQCGTRH